MWNDKENIPRITPVKEHFQKVDIDLLVKLMYKQTPSGDFMRQQNFLDFIEDWCAKNDIDVYCYKDSYGNMYITKGYSEIYPCVVSHIDVIHDYNPNLQIISTGNLVIGLDKSNGTQCGIGADPKNGVYFALEMLRTLDSVKVLLTLNEEIGMLGALKVDLSFFSNCSFLIQLDRRSFTNDVIEYTNGVQVLSKEMKKAMRPILTKYGLAFNRGTATDIGTLVDRGLGICACNWSNGSINEHMDNECCSVPHLLNGLNSAYECIIKLGYEKRWMHKTPERIKDRWYSSSVYHHTPHWRFQKEDEKYVKEQLAINQCPLCNSSSMFEGVHGEINCLSCESIYNIPIEITLNELYEDVSK